MLDEAWKSIRDSLLSRAVNPLSGALIVSWAVWNHRLLLTLFLGDHRLPFRFAYIDEVLYPGWSEIILFNVVAPLVSALAYIYLLPWPSRKVLKFSLERKKDMLNDAKTIQGLQLMSLADADKLRREMAELEAASLVAQKQLQERIDRLKIAHEQSTQNLLKANERVIYLTGAAALSRSDLTKERLTKFLTGLVFKLIFNAANGQKGQKVITFLADGTIGEGSNANENRWTIEESGDLVLISRSGGQFSRFRFDPNAMRFWGETVDPSVKQQDQYIELVSHPE